MLNMLEYLRRVTGKPRLDVQQAQFLISLYDYPDGITMLDFAKAMRVDPSFVSRTTKTLGTASKGREFVLQRIDPTSPKYRLVYLSQPGRDAIRNALEIARGERDMPRLPTVRDARSN